MADPSKVFKGRKGIRNHPVSRVVTRGKGKGVSEGGVDGFGALSGGGGGGCAVVGVSDPERGQAIVAVAEGSEAGVWEKTVREHLQRELAPYKVPREWLSVPALPRNTQGKVLKRELVAMLEARL